MMLYVLDTFWHYSNINLIYIPAVKCVRRWWYMFTILKED